MFPIARGIMLYLQQKYYFQLLIYQGNNDHALCISNNIRFVKMKRLKVDIQFVKIRFDIPQKLGFDELIMGVEVIAKLISSDKVLSIAIN